MFKIVTVENKNQEKDFVLFPFELYKDCDYWVPPIIKEELEAMDKSKNPVFKAFSSFFNCFLFCFKDLFTDFFDFRFSFRWC